MLIAAYWWKVSNIETVDRSIWNMQAYLYINFEKFAFFWQYLAISCESPMLYLVPKAV